MVEVWFFEKPGCINNTRQKQLLKQAGHQLQVINLLGYEWTAGRLKPFFKGMPVEEWFNPSAPAIKAGEVNPATLGQDQALALMMKDPLLIRRPLMQVGEEYRAGFDIDAVNRWIGLASQPSLDLETCPRQ